MDLFKTKTVINENTFRELKKYLIPRKQKIVLLVADLLAVVLMIIAAMIFQSYVFVVLLAVSILIYPLEYILLANRYVKMNIKRLQESIHAKECEYTTSFNDTGFKLINHSTNAVVTIVYEDIARFVETQTYYAVFTKADQFGVVNKYALKGVDERDELKNYLKHRCKGIRWERTAD